MPNRKTTSATASQWFSAREWAQGLNLKAHASTNIPEFAFRYAKHKERWDKAFAWLKNTDLDTIATGRYTVDGDNVYAVVADSTTKAFNDTRFEAHRKYADIQYVVRGREKIGLAPLSKALPVSPFDTEKDTGFFEIPEQICKYYIATQGSFFLFFPGDAHRPGIKVQKTGYVRKVVVKVRID